MQNYQNPKPSTNIWKSPSLLPQTTHLEILLYIEFWTFNSPKVVKYGIFLNVLFFNFSNFYFSDINNLKFSSILDILLCNIFYIRLRIKVFKKKIWVLSSQFFNIINNTFNICNVILYKKKRFNA